MKPCAVHLSSLLPLSRAPPLILVPCSGFCVRVAVSLPCPCPCPCLLVSRRRFSSVSLVPLALNRRRRAIRSRRYSLTVNEVFSSQYTNLNQINTTVSFKYRQSRNSVVNQRVRKARVRRTCARLARLERNATPVVVRRRRQTQLDLRRRLRAKHTQKRS